MFPKKFFRIFRIEIFPHFLRNLLAAWCIPRLIRWVLRSPQWTPLVALFWKAVRTRHQPPYGHLHRLAGRVPNLDDLLISEPPTNSCRSILFLNNSYYHFHYLVSALRRRGWDAVHVTCIEPGNLDRRFYHGEGVNLYSECKAKTSNRMLALHRQAHQRFRMVHFGGMHCMSLFPENWGWLGIPWDFIEWKRKGMKIGYTVSGCNDGVRQSTYKEHKNACSKCIWELRPDVCSDLRNSVWGEKLVAMCDLVSTNNTYGNAWINQPFVHREPLTTALDPSVWSPDLNVPQALRLPRIKDELILMHGFGNAEIRRNQGRDIKGSQAVISATTRLRNEGFNVRLEHPINIASRDMRFLQVQADIIVDQLNIGRYGAQAREGMMLGKPTICHIDKQEPKGATQLSCLTECPLVDATEATIYDVLKYLVSSPEERARIGRASRDYAIKWHAADAMAERFERVYDRVLAGLPVNIPVEEL